MAALSVRDVSKVYRLARQVVPALSNFTLELTEGQYCVLLGPSGSGKSTLLRLLAGLETVTSGGICMDGQDVTRTAPKDRNVALVFQHYALYPHLSVFDNLAFGLKMRKHSPAERATAIAEVARKLGIEPLLQRMPAHLSGGEQQRVALGRAIVRRPKLFLLDEPLANLDPALRLATRLELKRLQRESNITTIHVTHDQEEALALADQLVVMAKGLIQQIGAPMEVYRRPANRFVAGFVGSPPMRFLKGTLRRRNGQFSVDLDAAVIPLMGFSIDGLATHVDNPVDVGFRAEDVRFVPGNAAYQPVADEVGIPAAVEVIESLGYGTLITLRIDAGGSLTARAPAVEGITVGTRGRALVFAGRVHLFSNSGPRLN